MVNKYLARWRDWFLPGQCTLCAAPTHGLASLCRGCLATLPRPASACPRCAHPLPAAPGDVRSCGTCQHNSPVFDSALALYQYTSAVPSLIQQIKYGANLSLARELGEQLGDRVAGSTPMPADMLVPVPLHPKRLRHRGYNQALELARPVSQRLNIPLDAGAVSRIRATAPQQDLDRRERVRNLRDAFAVLNPVDGLRIAIIDDVMTSGATVTSLANVLKRAGAKEISVWVIARA